MSRTQTRQTTKRAADPFKNLRNVGPAARSDLAVLGITSLKQLAESDADHLYVELQLRTKQRHDPCVWDVFAAAIHQARTGEPRDWWTFTPERKRRQTLGEFPR
jgi:predicted flap endonuclease-1-like 5' DNA nuclease